MRLVFGVVGLLVALAIVAKSQLSASGRAGTPRAAPGAPPDSGTDAPRRIQQKVTADIGKALEQGARKDEAGQ